MNLTLVGDAVDGSDSVQCHTDLNSCCSRAHGDDGDIYQSRHAQQVDLRRRNNGDTSGIYRCTIETNAVHSDNDSDTTTQETVYAGLYASGGECAHGEEFEYSQ